jgi:hypothetical protein
MTRYVRNSSGRTIHLADCRYAKGQYARPWRWAEGKGVQFLIDTCEGFGYKACWWCRPFEGEL